MNHHMLFHQCQYQIAYINALFLAVFFRIRLTITASCPMNLEYFPMDRQLCQIEIESCKYTFLIINFKFKTLATCYVVLLYVSVALEMSLSHSEIYAFRKFFSIVQKLEFSQNF